MEAVIVKQPTSKVVLKTLEKIIKIAYVIIIALMLYAPIVFMIILSFNKALSGNEFTGFTIEWYAQMFQKEKLMSAIITTLSVAALSTILSTVFGTISAIGINSLSKKARKNSIILNNVYIGDNTYIENCIVESRDTIRANSHHVGEGEIKIVIEKNERYII